MRKDLFKKHYIDNHTKYITIYHLEQMNKEQKIYLKTHTDLWIIVPLPEDPGVETYVKLHEVLDENGEYLPSFKETYFGFNVTLELKR